MASKIKKNKPFSVTKAVKAAARDTVGTPRSTREIPDAKTKARKRATKHKPTIGKLLGEE
jgi:hypothetical protein